MTVATRTVHPNAGHWGAYQAEVSDGELVAIHPFPADPDPARLLENVPGSLRHRTRVTQPMVRAGWLDNGPGPSDKRGNDAYVPVSWERLVALLGGELGRVYSEHGASAVFGGSYGWASAGRFHHAQSQLHRFLNCLGGYTSSIYSYSLGAAEAIMPHVVGNARELLTRATTWHVLVENTELWLCFGGVPLKNTYVIPGGVGRHEVRGALERLNARGAEFVLFSPIRDDLLSQLRATWHPIAPGSDVAAMLAIAHTLIVEDLHDKAFLGRYCVGFERFERYVLGRDDGTPKSPEWAEPICEIPATELRSLARRLPGKRVMVTTTWSLQRTEFGEQKPWMGITLAAMLGQIGLPGGGYGFGYGCSHTVGMPAQTLGVPVLPQGENPVRSFIPVARTADMLLNPGAAFEFNGKRHTYPEIKLVYWAGGNPFHHHQHLGKLRRALATVDTVVVNEPFWTAMARHADIVVPSTLTLERNDIGGSPNDRYIFAMHKAVEPIGQARDDYLTFSALAEHLGVGQQFSEGRDEMGWLRHMYAEWHERASAKGYRLPDFDAFWDEGFIEMTSFDPRHVYLGAFRADPENQPLATPSGKIEIFSERVASFGYDDCPGHPTWLEPTEWRGAPRAQQFPLVLIANNPRTRLHSQLDVGAYSQSSKVQGREPLRMHPDDAAERGLADGDVARVFNDRGACLAGVVLSDALRPGVVQLSTGAWYDPLDPADPDSLCVHGNPNTVTLDRGTSRLAQASVGQHALVQVERWDAPLPPLRVNQPPSIEDRGLS
ncbi:MAG: molybdopterin oxidoreductase [Chloroflexi bacterium]|nr:MAG: molybdopterin oxidoreductase [Chloroflexota bacterium]